MRPHALAVEAPRVEDVDGDHFLGTGMSGGRCEQRVVVQAQVVAEPDDEAVGRLGVVRVEANGARVAVRGLLRRRRRRQRRQQRAPPSAHRERNKL